MKKWFHNLDFFLIRVLVTLFFLITNFLFDFEFNILIFIFLFALLIYDLITDIIVHFLEKDYNYEEFIIVVVSFLLFFTSQFRSSILIVLFYQIFNKISVTFLKLVNGFVVSNFLINDNYVLKSNKNITPEQIKSGDLVIVDKNQIIPVDGIIKEGMGLVKNGFFGNGKRKVNVKDHVLAGMVNSGKKIVVEAEVNFNGSLINKILEYMKYLNNQEYKLETKVKKILKFYTIIVYVISLLILVVSFSLYENITLLALDIVLVLLLSTAFISIKMFLPFIHYITIFNLLKNQIIIKDFNQLGKYQNTDLVILNKTGVATVGEFRITEVVGDVDILFKYLNCAEKDRNDRISNIIKTYYYLEIDDKKITNYQFFEGEGITFNYNNDRIYVGNYYLFKKNGILVDVDSLDKIGTIIHVAVNEKEIGYVVISDMIKMSLPIEVEKLKQNHFKVLVMSADNASITGAIAREIKANECYSSLLADEREFFTDYTKNKYASKSFYVSDCKDDIFLEYNDFGITLNERTFQKLSDIAFLDDDISRLILLTKISKRYTFSVLSSFVLVIVTKILLLVLLLLKIVNISIIILGELVLGILVLIIGVNMLNDRKK